MATEKEKKEVEIVINGQKANASIKEMEQAFKILNAQLKDMPKNTQEWKDKLQEVGKQDAAIKNVKNEINGVSKSLQDAKSSTSALGGVFGSVFGALTLTRVIGEVVNFVSEGLRLKAVYSDAFSDIQKTTGMTAEEVGKLNEKIGELDTRTSQLDLLSIAKVGGQIGIVKEEIEGFVESVDKAVVALGDEFSGGAEEVATSMGTLKNLFQETKALDAGTAINQIGSAINELGSAGTATGPVIAEFAARIGQLGDLAPQIDQTLGLGAALQELGMTADKAAGGLTNIFIQAGTESVAFAKQIGITQVEFKNLLNTNPNEMLLKLADSMKGLSNTQIIETMGSLKLGSQESIKVMSLLANKTDMVREKQVLASKAMKEATSLTNEFNIKNNNEAAQLAKTQKEWEKMKVAIGDQFLPIVSSGMAAMIPLLRGLTTGFVTFVNIIKAIPSFVKENKEAFIALGIAIISLNTAQIAATATTIYHSAVEKTRTAVTKAATAAQWLMNAAMSANPIGLVVAAVALLVGGFILLYKNSEKVRAGLSGLFDAAKKVFSNIAEAAFKIIGGVGDLLVGVFTLDLDKIKNGIKSYASGMAGMYTGLGNGVADAYTKGYDDKIKEEHPKQTADAKKRGEEKGKAEGKALTEAQAAALQKQHDDKLAADAKALEAEKERIKKQAEARKQAEADAKKQREQAAKDELKAAEMIAENKIKLIADEYEQKRAQIQANADKEIKNMVGTEDQRKLLIKQIRQQMWNELDTLEAENEAKKTEAALDIENRRQTAIAELKLLKAEEEGDPDDIRDAQIEQMNAEREIKLQDHTLLKEETDLINQEYDNKEKATREATAQEKRQKTLDHTSTGIQAAGQLYGAIVNLQNAETAKKLDDAEKLKNEKIKKLDEELAAGIISKEAYESAKSNVDAQYQKKVDKLKAEQQKRNKRAAIIQASINTALAITSALGGVWPAAIVFAALAAVMGGLQIAAIAKQPLSSFAAGGFTAPKRRNNGFTKWGDVVDHFAAGGHTGGSQGTFKDGGWVRTRRIGEIGEAGSEYVSPHWMISSPKYADIFNYLESERQRKRFAEGGFTDAPAIPANSTTPESGVSASEMNMLLANIHGVLLAINGNIVTGSKEIRVVNNIVEVDNGLNELYKIRAESVIM